MRDLASGEEDDGELFLLGERIADLAARINATESQMMTLIADFDRRGISYAKVRAITRVATLESEAELLEFAQAGSAAKLEWTVRLWRKLSREGELTVEEARHCSRMFSVFVNGDGMYVVKGQLEPEVGAVLMRAVEAASDALYRRESGAGGGGRDADDVRPKPNQRRADAVGLLAQLADGPTAIRGSPAARSPDDRTRQHFPK